MADLDSFEPPAERLRRCIGRHRTAESALFPFSGGSAPPLRLSRPAVEKERSYLDDNTSS